MNSEFDEIRRIIADPKVDGWYPEAYDIQRAVFGAPDMPGFERTSTDGIRSVAVYLESAESIWINFVFDVNVEAAIELLTTGVGRETALKVVTSLMNGRYRVRARAFGRARLSFDDPDLDGIQLDLQPR